MLHSKLKNIKLAIKEWMGKEKESEGCRVLELEKIMEDLEQVAENRDLSEAEINKKINARKDLMLIEDAKRCDLKQKAWIKWAIDGDENTVFSMVVSTPGT